MLTPPWALEMGPLPCEVHITLAEVDTEQELPSSLAHLRKGLELAVTGGLGFCFMLDDQEGPCCEGDI